MNLKWDDGGPIKHPYGMPRFPAIDPAINRRATFGHSYGIIPSPRLLRAPCETSCFYFLLFLFSPLRPSVRNFFFFAFFVFFCG